MKVLVVDDDRTIRSIVEVVLEDEWDVLLAESGAKALEIAQAEVPDLIVVDMHMPGMDGPETVGKLRAISKLSGTPIIFMTADEKTSDPSIYTNLGATGAIIKPINPTTLDEQLRKFLNR